MGTDTLTDAPATDGPAGDTAAAPPASCAHCTLPVPPGLFEPDAERQFCCSGCRTAWSLLHEHGLGQYYAFGDRRDRPATGSGRSYDEFDHDAFQALHVRPAADGLSEVSLYLEGVHCASCVWLVERVPLLLPGVARAELDVRRSRAVVTWDPAQVPLSQLARTLDQLGYPPHPFRGVARDAVRRAEDRRLLARIGVAGALAGNVMLVAFALYSGEGGSMASEHARFFRWLSLGLTLPALAWPGRVFFTGAIAALRTRTLHMDLPIAIALAAGFVRGAINTWRDAGPVYFDGLALLVFALLVGRYLQQRGQRLATDSSELLASLTPSRARLVEDDGTERDLPAEALVPGMTVRVRAAESFPADGTVVAGRTSVNAALLTGESRPVTVVPGEAVYAGTLNVAAPVDVTVGEAGESSRVARLLREVEEAAERRAPVVLAANRLAGWFVGVVLVVAAATWLWKRTTDPASALDDTIALLVVTCPCALALATPLAVATAVGRAARAGILVKGGDALELLARPGTLVLDKTGTLTAGESTLVAWTGDEDARRAVLALEAGVAHPIADGFRRAWEAEHGAAARALPVTDVEQVTGGGIAGTVDGRPVVLGAPAFVAARTGIDKARLVRAVSTLDIWLTPVVVAVDGRLAGVAGLGDAIRPDAKPVLDRLRADGWRTVMASGDAPGVAAAVGSALGFGRGDVHGGLQPEEKLALVRALRLGGERVVMVGDGVNDAAAIAAATVGVGVHGGAEACLATADVYLARAGLAPLGELADGARRTLRVIRRNFAFSLGYNVIGASLAIAGVLTPLVAAVLMPLSSITVVLASWFSRSFDPAPEAPTSTATATPQPMPGDATPPTRAATA